MGEALPPTARRLLADMGLLEEFLRGWNLPCHGNRAFWGDQGMIETDFLSDTDGHGWHFDRASFDAWLRGVAVTRGALLAMPARLDAVERDDAYWHVRLAGTDGQLKLRAAVLIDCGGRAAPVARRLGARPSRLAKDRLMCSWAVGRDRDGVSGAGFSVVEAAEEGWWYTAPMPGQRRVVAFFTDSDLPARRSVSSGPALLAHAMATDEIGRLLDEAEFEMLHAGWRPAYSWWLEVCAGPGWFAAGDASISFDPLSSQGLLHALFTGLAAAEGAERWIRGDVDAYGSYGRVLEGIHAAYWRNLKHCYVAEPRWLAAPFWRRRLEIYTQPRLRTMGVRG
jgi:flavin-dependent dehydrogenase